MPCSGLTMLLVIKKTFSLLVFRKASRPLLVGAPQANFCIFLYVYTLCKWQIGIPLATTKPCSLNFSGRICMCEVFLLFPGNIHGIRWLLGKYIFVRWNGGVNGNLRDFCIDPELRICAWTYRKPVHIWLLLRLMISTKPTKRDNINSVDSFKYAYPIQIIQIQQISKFLDTNSIKPSNLI